MATSSITKNFVVSGKKQVEQFADAIEMSYKESLSESVHLLADTEKYMKQMKYTE